ncbi:autotransporter outer membrane beta-barrel domain-containing protein [Rhizobium sp. LC145]|uniref:autotransporter family protein n=1 Tax=Rhizobium sp. LC145 TaxID=1120688 RepID=UPI00062A394F|nr:autotransporter outer membrane beta-barrel domain-containing protein [Rhizobium sp. LC145]KKX33367.1 hypothetical protein YH62_07650 [Rhizobium sp. LC145]TKT58613.1 autotransporter outer membrane beta-barrel domain-containing protein [Rhizobiaceae bacterium LC148]
MKIRIWLTSTALWPVLAGAWTMSVVSPDLALAACSTLGGVTTCDSSAPNPHTATVGTGRGDHGGTVTLGSGAQINVNGANAISLGNNASITLQSGSTVGNTANSWTGGLFNTGLNTIEFNSNGTLLVEEGASIIKKGSGGNAETVNVHGFGNRIENRGLIQAENSAAIWFQDEVRGTKNVVDNYGTIEKVGGVGSVIGSSGGAGIQFYNRTGAQVIGGISFGGGNDDLFFEASSLVTGNINGGGGTNNLTLQGASGSDDTLRGNISNFSSLTKDGEGKWTVAGNLGGFTTTTVRNGTLALTGDNANYTGAVMVETAGTLEARAQSLPTRANAADNVNNVTNNGLVRFTQSDDGTYIGQITGTGAVEKVGAGVLTLAPVVAAGNTYSGGTSINEGTLAVGADNVLGAATGGVSFDGGTLRFDSEFDLASSRAITIEDGGGTIDTQGFTTTISQGTTGDGKLTKVGAGTLELTGDNAHTGGTSVQVGTLALGDASGAAAALSGGGAVDIASGATLGGYGNITGDLVNSGTFAVANALSTFSSGPNGNFTVNGNVTNNGLVQIGGTGIGNSLTVSGDYAGNGGTVGLNTYLGTDGSPSDKLIIDGGTASGTSGLQITNVGGSGALTQGNGILVVEAVNGGSTDSGAFSLAGPAAAGAYDYYLYKGSVDGGSTDNWYLRNTVSSSVLSEPAPGTPSLPIAMPGSPSPTPPTPGATPVVGDVIPLYRPEVPTYSVIPPAAREAALATLGTFHERRGEQSVLAPGDDLSAAWFRGFGQSTEQSWSGTVSPSIDGSTWGIQAGFDILRRESGDGHSDTAGVFLGYAGLSADVRGQALGWNNVKTGKIDVDATSLGAYWTHIGPSGWYLDGVIMGTWYGGSASSDRGFDVDIDGHGFTASLEGGYPIAITDNWVLEPQAQIIWQSLSLDDQRDAFSPVSFDSDNAWTGRIGARLQGNYQTDQGLLQPYLKANIWHGFKTSDTIRFDTDAITTEGESTSLELGAGLVYALTENVSAFAAVDYTFDIGGERKRAFEGNIGLRVRW